MSVTIYADASVNHTIGKAIGCVLIVDTDNYVYRETDVVISEFETKKSTEAEMTNLLVGLKLVDKMDNIKNIIIYTDCMGFKNVIDKDKDRIELYREIIEYKKKFVITVNWTKGHIAGYKQNEKHQLLFGAIDKLTRKLVRKL